MAKVTHYIAVVVPGDHPGSGPDWKTKPRTKAAAKKFAVAALGLDSSDPHWMADEGVQIVSATSPEIAAQEAVEEYAIEAFDTDPDELRVLLYPLVEPLGPFQVERSVKVELMA